MTLLFRAFPEFNYFISGLMAANNGKHRVVLCRTEIAVSAGDAEQGSV